MKKPLFFIITYLLLHNVVFAQCSNAIPKRPAVGWGPMGRPATECESLFFKKCYPVVMGTITKGVAALSDQWGGTGPDYSTGSEIELRVGDGDEKNFTRCLGGYDWSYKSSDMVKAFESVQGFMQEQVSKTNGKDPDRCKAAMMENELNQRYGFVFHFAVINQSEDALEVQNAKIEMVKVPGCSYAIRVTRDKKITDCFAEDERPDKHYDELHLYIGNWSNPKITTQGFIVKSNFNKSQSKLSVQNMLIIITCERQLQDEIVNHIDLAKLAELVTK